MSNIGIIIEERAADIGNFLVGRLLPFREKRAVGPFVFIDHMGPAQMKDYQNIDIPPHPHIGLSTLTYLFEGAMMHRDSLGTEIEIQPGAVNWMTAGKGIVHSERTPEYLRHAEKRMHGLQIWIALPKALENMEPSFAHIEANELPEWEEGHVTFKLIAGEAFGRKSPVPVYSPLYFIELKAAQHTKVDISSKLYGESALYILQGTINSEGNTYHTKQLLVAKDTSFCSFEMSDDCILYIFGGNPFPEEHFIYWNFVHSDKAVIEQAKLDWAAQRFPKVPNETEFVPLPNY